MGVICRVRQVAAACRAKVEPQDYAFIAQWLSEEEQQLFYRMDIPHQYHALRVAYTARNIAEREHIQCDTALLIRCALLHDIAKQAGTMSTFDKILCVLLDKIMPRRARRLACPQRGGNKVKHLRYAVYLYYHHAALAADELGGRVGAIVRYHHHAYRQGEPAELTILRRADDLH